MADISKINAVALANIAKLDAVLAANLAKVNGLVFSTAPAFVGLLDTYTGAAAGYSVRQLKSGVTVAMRVRRDTAGGTGDDDEADIAFDTSLTDPTISLDSAISNASVGVTATTLGQFLNVGTVGGTTYSNPDSLTVTASCYVDELKDQSGNANHASQAAFGSQPQIHDGTVNTDLITENGKPAVEFDGTNDYFESSNVISGTTARSIFSVNNDTGNTDSAIYTATKTNTGSGTRYLFGTAFNANNVQVVVRGGSANGSYTGNAQHSVSHFLAASSDINTLSMFVDGSALTLTTSSEPVNTHNDNAFIGAFEGPTQYWNGTQQELIVYASDQSSNRTGIETDINTYFSIY